jgi:ABC-type nitrate/sulfonate/bicarbonate transport system permease component
VAFIPILVVWFGIEREFVVASVVVASSILITFSTAAGVRDAVLHYTEVSESFGVRGRYFLLKVLLPAALPFVANGTRLSIQRALVAVIVAEFLVGVPGLGFVIRTARVTLQADRLFAMAVLLMIVGIILFNATTRVERRLSRWRPQAF